MAEYDKNEARLGINRNIADMRGTDNRKKSSCTTYTNGFQKQLSLS